MKNIIVAPNAFKGALDASQAAKAIAKGFERSRLPYNTTLFPVGDGGDGTGVLLSKVLAGEVIKTVARDPLGRFIDTSYTLIHDGKTAVIEMADIAGLRLLSEKEQQPMNISDSGVGELILHALDRGVSKIIIGMGGSATVGGGSGILHALGARFYDRKGQPLQPIPRELKQLHTIDVKHVDPQVKTCEFIVLCDVGNVLLGEEGAAAVFGPQKGASRSDVAVLEEVLNKWRAQTMDVTGVDMNEVEGGGTAGGAAAGMYAFLDAKLVRGIDYFLSLTGFEEVMKKGDLLVTGEGHIDEQTLSGKAPAGVATIARKWNVPVIGLGGGVPERTSERVAEFFDILVPINHEITTLSKAMEETEENLTRTAEMIGNLMTIG